jgi:hypothetical protein
MKQKVYNILREKNIDYKKFNVDILCEAGIKNIINNIEFYYDKHYTCESVLKELFTKGVIEQIKKTQSLA